MSNWYLTKQECRYDDREGQELFTDYYEQLTEIEPPVKSPVNNAFDRVFSYQDGKATYQESYYTGNTTSNDGFVYNTTSVQEPLETHPMFRAGGDFAIEDSEWESYYKYEDANDTSWEPARDGTTNFKKFWEYKQKGVDSWLNYSIEATVTTIEPAMPNFNKVGRIDTLPSPRAITLRGGRTWLLQSIDADRLSKDHETWKVTMTFRSSGDGGWDADIYHNT
jgi:hypothetical protein